MSAPSAENVFPNANPFHLFGLVVWLRLESIAGIGVLGILAYSNATFAVAVFDSCRKISIALIRARFALENPSGAKARVFNWLRAARFGALRLLRAG